MTEFIMGFTVYTLGIIGLLVIGYVVAKYLINNTGRNMHKQKSFLKVEQAIGLEARKTVYILKAGKQKFLVATTPDSVCFLSELDKDNLQTTAQPQNQQQQEFQNNINMKPQQQMHPDLEAKLKYINFTKSLVGQKPIQR